MQVLFVHGMGRSPLSGWPLLLRLRRAGLRGAAFGYSAAFEDFTRISLRLAARLIELGQDGDYVLVGHSLGGVLLRDAVNALPSDARLPRHVFLLGSPQRSSRLARMWSANKAYRALTRDCGQLLASRARMSKVGALSVPTTSIVGVRGLSWRGSPFAGEANDGVVALSEVSASWLDDQVQVAQVHTLLPSSSQVAKVILERLARQQTRQQQSGNRSP